MKYITDLIIKSPRPATFWGWTPTGKKIHLGTEALWEDRRMIQANTFCGPIMSAPKVEKGKMIPPSRVGEFCRRCFMTLAWSLLEQRMYELEEELKKKNKVKGVGNGRQRSSHN